MQVASILEADFGADVLPGDPPELRLTGSADSDTTVRLTSLLSSLHDRLSAKRIPTVVVDITALELMCASAFNALTVWLMRIADAPAEARYHVRIRSNPTIPWQRRTLMTLSCFATDLISVES